MGYRYFTVDGWSHNAGDDREYAKATHNGLCSRGAVFGVWPGRGECYRIAEGAFQEALSATKIGGMATLTEVKEIKEYVVTWSINWDGVSPEDVAEKIEKEFFRSDASPVLEVIDSDGKRSLVDMMQIRYDRRPDAV